MSCGARANVKHVEDGNQIYHMIQIRNDGSKFTKMKILEHTWMYLPNIRAYLDVFT